MTTRGGQPWIHSATADGLFILLPPIVATAVAVAAPVDAEVSVWAWAVLIIGIDVAHVYGTLFRTYLHPDALRQRPALYVLTPLLGWFGGAALYAVDRLVFWRALAYLATFHFIRQQYGFTRIYARREGSASSVHRVLDAAVIYAATLYPLVYWHTHLPRNFHWFVDGDFMALPSIAAPIGLTVYVTLLLAYAVKEVAVSLRRGFVNIPKNLVIAGTIVSWYVGIIVLNGDLAFTITNVVSHGVPYLALIWIHGNRELDREAIPGRHDLERRLLFAAAGVPLFVAFLVALAYVEEGLWDGLVWRDHASLFSAFHILPRLRDRATLTWVVPLLALPQITHYLLDGFIWRLNGAAADWQTAVFRRDADVDSGLPAHSASALFRRARRE